MGYKYMEKYVEYYFKGINHGETMREERNNIHSRVDNYFFIAFSYNDGI